MSPSYADKLTVQNTSYQDKYLRNAATWNEAVQSWDNTPQTWDSMTTFPYQDKYLP